MTKIILCANTDWYLFNFRLSLAQAVREDGADVVLVSPPGEFSRRLQEHEFRWLPLKFSRRGLNPFAEISSFFSFLTLYRQEEPDLVHHFTIKPIIYGSLAARVHHMPAVVNSVTGLGYLFVNPGSLARLLKELVKPLYRIALSVPNSYVIFQNRRDQELFVDQDFVSMDRTVIIPGSGVNPTQFKPTPEPLGELVIMMASRMLWDKGVGELVEATRILRRRGFFRKGNTCRKCGSG